MADRHPVTHAPLALWLGLELRCDRVYDALCHSLFYPSSGRLTSSLPTPQSSTFQPDLAQPNNMTDGILFDNVAFLGGDANKMLSDRLIASSIQQARFCMTIHMCIYGNAIYVSYCIYTRLYKLTLLCIYIGVHKSPRASRAQHWWRWKPRATFTNTVILYTYV